MSGFDGIVLHVKTLRQLEAVLVKPPAVILLSAPDNYYLDEVASRLAAAALGLAPGKPTASSNFLELSPQPDERYGVEAAGRAIHFINQKSSAKSGAVTKCLLIHQSDQLSLEGQNALLKLLEDLPAKNMIILTAADKSSLLETVVSRCQPITLIKPESSEVSAWLQTMFEGKDTSTALRRADGWPGRAKQLLNQDATEVDDDMATTKSILGGTAFDRLAVINQIGNDRDRAVKLCELVALIAQRTLSEAKLEPKSAQKWAKIAVAANESCLRLAQNTNIKLTLTSMVLTW